MKCKYCGAEIKSNSKFCTECGAPVDAEATPLGSNNEVTATPAQASQVVPTTAQPAPAKPAGSEVIEFITSIPTFYLKGTVEIANDHVRLNVPNTVLGLIPCGSRGGTYDVNHIASVHTDSRLNIKRMLCGALCVLFGLGGLGGHSGHFWWFIVGVLGVLLVLNSFENDVFITLDSSRIIDIPLVVFEKEKTALIEEKILAIVHARTYDTNTRIHATSAANTVVNAYNTNTDRIISAIECNNQAS